MANCALFFYFTFLKPFIRWVIWKGGLLNICLLCTLATVYGNDYYYLTLNNINLLQYIFTLNPMFKNFPSPLATRRGPLTWGLFQGTEENT